MIDDKEISDLNEMLKKILDKAPEEDEASYEENEMLAEVQNCFEIIRNYLYYKAQENEILKEL